MEGEAGDVRPIQILWHATIIENALFIFVHLIKAKLISDDFGWQRGEHLQLNCQRIGNQFLSVAI